MTEVKYPLRIVGLFLLAGFLVSCSDDESDSSGDAGTTMPNEMSDESNLPAGSATAIRSNFDDGLSDGWTITENSIESGVVSMDGICGLVEVDPSPGFLCANADVGGTSYFIAPEKFHGDLNMFASLNFSLVANGGRYYDSDEGFDGDISISNGVARAFYTFSEDQRPTDVWKTYQIQFSDMNWVVDDGADLATVLQSVTELRIRAEFGVGDDNTGLDDVSLQQIGVLQLSDPDISPLFADIQGIAPTLVMVDYSEILLNDAKRLVDKITASGGTARLVISCGLWHVWSTWGDFPESTCALDDIKQHIIVDQNLHTNSE